MPPDSEESIWGECVGDAVGIEKDEIMGELLYDSTPEADPVDE